MSHDTEFRTTEEKVQNIEHYLVRKIDGIQRLLITAIGISALAACLAIWGLSGQQRMLSIANEVGTRTPGATQTGEHMPVAEKASSSHPEIPPDAAPEPPKAPSSKPAKAPTNEQVKAPTNEQVKAATSSEPASSAPAPEATAPELPGMGLLAVEESAIAEEIVGLSPQSTASRFPRGQSQVFCWSRIVTPDFDAVPVTERAVTHRWIHEGTVVKERRITIGSGSYRVYSMVPNVGDKPGSWRVDIVDAKGRIIGSERFVVG